MGWLQTIFKSKELIYLEELYKNEKEAKLKLEFKINDLEEQIKLLQNKLNSVEVATNEKTNIKKKLSPKEKELYQIYNDLNKEVTQIEFSTISNIHIASLRTMVSRIRKKGYSMTFI